MPGEREDLLFYEYLISVARSICVDEIRHNLVFKKIYKDFSCQDVMENYGEEFTKPSSYEAGDKH